MLKIQGVLITSLEVRMLQFILMNNKIIHTMDYSDCIDDARSMFNTFMRKFDQFCNVRSLTLDNMVPDLSSSIEDLGVALGANMRLTSLSLRQNKIKTGAYCAFWIKLVGNGSLRKLDIANS